MADITTFNIRINSVTFTGGARYFGLNIENYYPDNNHGKLGIYENTHHINSAKNYRTLQLKIPS